jgi:hypothetical protein
MQQNNHKESRDILAKARILLIDVVLELSICRHAHCNWGDIPLSDQVSSRLSVDANTENM